eukprot:m.52555 g.52555  ORF g.52555 m.52555 type:complete len:252 (+) comp12712_c0_seq1:76-831(+)
MGCCTSTQLPPANQAVSAPATARGSRVSNTVSAPRRSNTANVMHKSEVLRQREQFWATAPAYGGRREVWDALKAACETDDMALQHAILESAGIKLPQGTLRLVYDELGHAYEIPEYCFRFPANMIDDTSGSNTVTLPHTSVPSSARSNSGGKKAHQNAAIDKESILNTSKGEPTKVKVLLSTGDRVTINLGQEDTIQRLLLLLERDHNVSASSLMIVFLGKPVPPTATIGSLDLHASDVLQAFIFPSVSVP